MSLERTEKAAFDSFFIILQQQVSYIKKVDPGSSPCRSPTRAPANSKPTPNKGASWKPTSTPNKGLTPQKSFKESIEEKAAQMGRKPISGDGLPPRAPSTRYKSILNACEKKSGWNTAYWLDIVSTLVDQCLTICICLDFCLDLVTYWGF